MRRVPGRPQRGWAGQHTHTRSRSGSGRGGADYGIAWDSRGNGAGCGEGRVGHINFIVAPCELPHALLMAEAPTTCANPRRPASMATTTMRTERWAADGTGLRQARRAANSPQQLTAAQAHRALRLLAGPVLGPVSAVADAGRRQRRQRRRPRGGGMAEGATPSR